MATVWYRTASMLRFDYASLTRRVSDPPRPSTNHQIKARVRSPRSPNAAERSPYQPSQSDEGRKDEHDDSREGDGKVNVMHNRTGLADPAAIVALGGDNTERPIATTVWRHGRER